MAKYSYLFILVVILFGLFLCHTTTFTFMEGLETNNTNNKNNNSNNKNSASKNWDNYNHYKQSTNSLTSGQTFMNQEGGTIVVSLDPQGIPSLQITAKEGDQPVLFSSKNTEGYTTQQQQGQYGTITTFYGPQGETAKIIQGDNGLDAIQVQTSTGTTTYTQHGSIHTDTNSGITSTQYYGSTGTTLNNSSYHMAYGLDAGSITGPQGNTAYYAQGPEGNTVVATANDSNNANVNTYYGPNGGTAGSVTGPQGNTAYYAQPQAQGISQSMIPPGQEDLYILKSEIVPPVCPACPVSSACPREEPCPACPACARCPEPSFECKKVPNYNTINDSYLPIPMLNDFSKF